MIYSIQDFSDSQIEELRQCPGVNIDIDKHVAEVPFVAEGLFTAIANRDEAIKELQKGKEPISDETLQDIYLEAMNKINDSYIEGTIKYIQGHHKELDTKIDEVDKQINEIWESCLQGKASLNDFNATLASYKSLYMHGIDLFKEHLTTEDGNNKDENETLCRRCGKPGERYCYGEDKFGDYKFGDFCLGCRPF
jgi:hypothetical protein